MPPCRGCRSARRPGSAWLADQRAGDGDALLLASAVVVGRCLARWAMPTLSQHPVDARLAFVPGNVVVEQGKLDILANRQLVDQIEALKMKPMLLLSCRLVSLSPATSLPLKT